MKWKYKIPFSFVSIILLLTAANFFSISRALRELQEERLKTSEVLFARSLAERLYRRVIEKNTSEITSVLFDEQKLREEKIEYILVFDKKENLLAHTYLGAIPENLLKLKTTFKGERKYIIQILHAGDIRVYDIAVPVMEGIRQVGNIHVGVRGSFIQNTILTASSSSLKITFLVTIISIMLALLISNSITGPITQLTAATASISRGKLDARVEIPSQDEFGQLARSFNIMIENVKKSKEAQQDAKESAEEANRAKSVFLSNMSHELRTPLNAIIGYSEMLIEECAHGGNEDFIPDLDKILTAGKHLLTLINDVLDLSKIEAGKMKFVLEDFDIDSMIQDVVATLRPLVDKNANRLETHCHDGAGTMHADLIRVRQILSNLLSNACKFTEKGTITLDALRETATGNDCIRFLVSDTGIGITKEQTNKLFQAFAQVDPAITRKYGGTGLGLAISHKFCQMMGGDISVESEYGKGTTFTVRLPAHVKEQEKEAEEKESPHSEVMPPAGGNTVLVIDDDPLVRDILKRYLVKEGFYVADTTNGEDGLKLARELKPLAITLDILMPSMDGWEIMKKLKMDPVLNDIPVIIISMIDERNMGYALGAAHYLLKPVDRHRLVDILRQYHSKDQTGTTLVVDDDPTIRKVIRRTLEKNQWKVSEAENGKTALESIFKNKPDVIILDLMMPVMDGFEFVMKLRKEEKYRTIPIVVLTAKNLTAEDLLRLNGYVEKIISKKAYSRDDLLHEIRDLILGYSTKQAAAKEKV